MLSADNSSKATDGLHRRAHPPLSAILAICACFLLMGCPDTGTEPDSDSIPPRPDGGPGVDGGTETDGGVPVNDERPLTISPLECQADLERLVDEDFEIRDHPVPYKDQLFVTRLRPTQNGDRLALVSLLEDRTLLIQEQTIPGIDPEEFAFIYGIGNKPFIAPDLGEQNSPEFPIAFIGQLVRNLDRRNILLRIDAQGAARIELTSGDVLGFGGSVVSFSNVLMGPGDDLYFMARFEDDNRDFVVRQSSPGAPIQKILAVGDALRTGEASVQRFVAAIDPPRKTTSFGDVIVRVLVKDEAENVEGFAYLAIDTFFGDLQCLATDASLSCGGILVADGQELLEFDSDGATTAGVVRAANGEPELHYKVVAEGRVEEFRRNEQVQGFTFNNFKTVRTCPTNNSVYFVGGFFRAGRGSFDELMRIDERGNLTQITDFGSLLDVEALEGETPDEIRNFSVSYNCDAVMYTWGPSRPGENIGYEGYWEAYAGGDVIEVIDETAGRADNGNGDVMGVGRSRSGIDPNADRDAMVTIGPKGEFYFVPRLTPASGGVPISSYFRATKPVNRCRSPVEVNSTADTEDSAPGDGACDTGQMVGSDSECTLRAALQEANALPGRDAINVVLTPGSVVSLERALPPVTSRVSLEGNGIVVDGRQLRADEVGLDVRVPNAEVSSIALTNFPSHGLRAIHAITLDGVESFTNCGWGLWLEDKAAIRGTARTSSIARNGSGDGCTGGGIFSDVPLSAGMGLQISQVAADHNNGPGIMAKGLVKISQSVRARHNRGAGVHLEDQEGGDASRLSQAFGTLTVRGNRDHGISVVSGDLDLEWGNVVADGNCRFGIHVEDGKANLGGAIARNRANAHSIRNNGRTPPDSPGGVSWGINNDGDPVGTPFVTCGGGGVGIFGIGAEDREGPSRVVTATIANNQGPGIATTDAIRISDAWITNNFGPGVVFFDESLETTLETTVVRFDQGPPSTVEFNAGAGIEVDSGSVLVHAPLIVRNNVGSGIEVDEGHISLNLEVGEGITQLGRNGDASQMCQPWRVDPSGWVKLDEIVCPHSDGAHTGDGNIRAVGAIVRDNLGAGFRAEDREDEGHGIVDLELGQVCGNGEADVGRILEYNMVDQTCP